MSKFYDEKTKPFSAEDFAGWYTPHNSVELLKTHLTYSAAINALVTRLRSGLLRAGAAKAVCVKPELTSLTPVKIPTYGWKHIQTSSLGEFWRSSQVELTVSYEFGSVSVAYFGIRFESEGVRELLPDPPIMLARSTANATEAPPKSASGRVVTEALLTAFVALHAQAFPSENTEDRLWEAAKAYFDDRDVPRSRMRPAIETALGPRQRGRRAIGKAGSAD